MVVLGKRSSDLRSLGMALTAQQECFGDAFLLAVAGVGGCAVALRRPDDDSIDWTLSCRLPRRPRRSNEDLDWRRLLKRSDSLSFETKELRRSYSYRRTRASHPRFGNDSEGRWRVDGMVGGTADTPPVRLLGVVGRVTAK